MTPPECRNSEQGWLGLHNRLQAAAVGIGVCVLLAACPATAVSPATTCEELSAAQCQQAADVAIAELDPADPAPAEVVVRRGSAGDWVAVITLVDRSQANVALTRLPDGQFVAGLPTPPTPPTPTAGVGGECDRHDDLQLEATLPNEVAGVPVCTESIGRFADLDALSRELGPGALLPHAIVDGIPGASVSDFSMAFGTREGEDVAFVTAIRMRNTTGEEILAVWTNLNDGFDFAREGVGGKEAVRVDPPGVIGPTYHYASAEALYTVEAEMLTETELEEVFRALP